MLIYIHMRCSHFKIVLIILMSAFLCVLSVPYGQAAAATGGRDKAGDMRAGDSLKALMRLAVDERENWHMRIKAIDALAASGAPMVTDALMEEAANACPAIKWHAIVGLGGYDDDSRVADALMAALDDPTMYIREAAIEALGKIRAGKAVDYIGGALLDDHFAIRLKAVRALESIGGEQALLFLKRSADHDADPFIRDEAAAAARRLSSQQRAKLRL